MGFSISTQKESTLQITNNSLQQSMSEITTKVYYNQHIRRITITKSTSFTSFLLQMKDYFPEVFETEKIPNIFYQDEEGDQIFLTNDQEWKEALKIDTSKILRITLKDKKQELLVFEKKIEKELKQPQETNIQEDLTKEETKTEETLQPITKETFDETLNLITTKKEVKLKVQEVSQAIQETVKEEKEIIHPETVKKVGKDSIAKTKRVRVNFGKGKTKPDETKSESFKEQPKDEEKEMKITQSFINNQDSIEEKVKVKKERVIKEKKPLSEKKGGRHSSKKHSIQKDMIQNIDMKVESFSKDKLDENQGKSTVFDIQESQSNEKKIENENVKENIEEIQNSKHIIKKGNQRIEKYSTHYKVLRSRGFKNVTQYNNLLNEHNGNLKKVVEILEGK